MRLPKVAILSMVSLVLAVPAVTATSAWAQPLASTSSTSRARRERSREIVLKEIVVEGRTPGTFYVLSRANPEPEAATLRRSFVDQVIRSVESSPF